MSQNEDSQKGEGTDQNDITQPNKPKKFRKIGGKIDPNRSKSAPIEVEDSDENEVQHLDYTINSTSIHIEAPNTNTGASSDKKGNRILVYQMFFEY